MLVLQLFGALLHKDLQVVILDAESGFKFLLPERDALFPGVQERLTLPQAHLSSDGVIPHH